MQTTKLNRCNASMVQRVMSAARRVHKTHGKVVTKSVFQPALIHELTNDGMRVHRRTSFKHTEESHSELRQNDMFFADLMIDECLLLELETNDLFGPTRISRIMTRPELSRLNQGYYLSMNSLN